MLRYTMLVELNMLLRLIPDTEERRLMSLRVICRGIRLMSRCVSATLGDNIADEAAAQSIPHLAEEREEGHV